MRMKRVLSIRVACWLLAGVSLLVLGACAGERNAGPEEPLYETEETGDEATEENSRLAEQAMKLETGAEKKEIPLEPKEEVETVKDSETETAEQVSALEPKLIEEDWSEYFDGLNGAAVLYDPSVSQYMLYHPELAETRRSPCSTFKIISSMIALESGIMEPEDSMRTWSGEVFWNENWNHDIAFQEAFRVSCVWYFRELIDEIGPERMQAGFWIESSLAISPKEQAEVMERIFGGDSVCSEETTIPVYGKTGMGKAEGIVVDAWFTGFAEGTDRNVYFCVYLGRTDERNVSSAAAREIAVRIVENYCK